ncbi:MAG: rhodanese [Thiomonas sp. 13-66-29]|nr:MAG: rhodanese [Thiomonas sp. 13-66-29]
MAFLNPLLRSVVSCLGWVLSAACCSAAYAAELPGPLVSVQWLHDHAKAVQIVDIRDDIDSLTSDPTFNTEGGKKVLSKVGGYVPGALSVNFWAIRDKRDIDGHKVDFLLPTSSDFQAVMQASLLEADKPVVLVPTGDDASSLQEAAYLAYALQVFGMPADEVAILNGGTHAWIAAGYPVDTDAIAPMTSGHWVAKHADMKLVATTQQVLAASKHPGRPILVDARPMAQFVGVEQSIVATEAGRIPGARSLPPSVLYRTAKDGSARFLHAAQYRAILPLVGLSERGPMIVYCNTGQYAASTWFILTRLVGDQQVRVYPGSINEWSHLGYPMLGLPGQETG